MHNVKQNQTGNHKFNQNSIPVSNQIFHYTRCIAPKRVTEFAGPISVALRSEDTAPFKEMLQRWRAVGNTVSDLTGRGFFTCFFH